MEQLHQPKVLIHRQVLYQGPVLLVLLGLVGLTRLQLERGVYFLQGGVPPVY
jgi:hypothetical protein